MISQYATIFRSLQNSNLPILSISESILKTLALLEPVVSTAIILAWKVQSLGVYPYSFYRIEVTSIGTFPSVYDNENSKNFHS